MKQLKSEYINSNLTWLDKKKKQSIIIAPTVLCLYIVYGLLFGVSHESGAIVGVIFIISGFTSAILHSQTQKKINLLIEKYEHSARN